MSQSDLKSAHDDFEGSGLGVDDVCGNSLLGEVVVECFEVMDGTISRLRRLHGLSCHFLDAVM